MLLLFALVLWGRFGAVIPAVLSLALAAVLAATVFEAGAAVLGVALGKGLWLALWILLVVWPALLLYRVASVGGLERLGRLFTSVLPRRRENLLIVAWVFPSFIQGVAGFGTPIAVTAPLLVAMGWGPARAVAYPLIGYHWSVTFGSMGSSFYMASLTAGLTSSEQPVLAAYSALFLAVNCVLAGALVLVFDGGLAGLREGLGVLLPVGIPMAATLVAVAVLVPAIATLASASVGFLLVSVLAVVRGRNRRNHVRVGASAATASGPVQGRGGRPSEVDAGRSPREPDETEQNPRWAPLLLAPYVYLLVVALPVFLFPASREWVTSRLTLAPSFTETKTGLGWVNPAVSDYSTLEVLAHPGTYITLASILGYLTFRLWGLWRGPKSKGLVRAWISALPKSSYSIVLLACLATVLVDAGMVSVLARGSAEVAGSVYPAVGPLLGAVGSFMTGSTTSSNALLASFQAHVAELLHVEPVILVAAQTAGGNVGNSLAPVVVLVGAGAVSATDAFPHIIRACLLPAAVLLAAVSGMCMVATLLPGWPG
ncbi:MAG: L-lactate permease [Actinomycetota bacterium]|nr:L-lactate permease [Actinomycetota bacterium]